MILLRSLVRLLSFALLVVLALVGLAVAVAAVDPSGVASPLGLPSLRDTLGGWFASLEADGPIALVGALCGGGAVLLGLGLLAGLLIPGRERLVQLEQTEHGTLSARRRPLAQIATHLTEQARGVTGVHAKVKGRRRGGGSLRVRADRPRNVSPKEAEQAVTANLEAITGPFKLKPAVRTRLGDGGSRVQ